MMMVARQNSEDSSIGISLSFIFSAVIHMAVFLFVFWLGTFVPKSLRMQDTYYVDVVNLPVASPQAGDPAQKGSDTPQAPPPVAKESKMALPPPKPAKSAVKPNTAASESLSFAERMAKLEKKAEETEFDRKLKTVGSGKAGMPAGSGKEGGSDYTAYIKSRLVDALDKTASFTSRNPEMEVRLFIDADGKLARRKTERSSGDYAFEISVLRAIELASEKFPPPPGRKMYNEVFLFKPKGITSGKK